MLKKISITPSFLKNCAKKKDFGEFGERLAVPKRNDGNTKKKEEVQADDKGK